MTQVEYPGNFPTIPELGPYSVVDVVEGGGLNAVTRTPGTTIINVVENSPGNSSIWKVISLSVQLYLSLTLSGPTTGLLGEIWAGFVLDPTATSQAQAVQNDPRFGVVSPPLLPFPSDTSLISKIWDGSTDRVPPINPQPTTGQGSYPGPGQMLGVNGQIAPSIAKTLFSGQQVGVGIWMTPSILEYPIQTEEPNAYGLQIAYASYSMVVDR